MKLLREGGRGEHQPLPLVAREEPGQAQLPFEELPRVFLSG